jgi:endonuclease I
LDAGLQENVDQIGLFNFPISSYFNWIFILDAYCVQLLQDGNTKAITDLILCGYTELINQLKASDENDEETNNFINIEIPQLSVWIFKRRWTY